MDVTLSVAPKNKYPLGEYLKLLCEKKPDLKVSFAVEWEWEVSAKDLQKVIEGKVDAETGLVCPDFWDFYIDGEMDRKNRCGFGGNMVVGANCVDTQDDAGDEPMVGFIWRLSEIPKGYTSVIVDVELYCPQIEFYVQFFDVKMQRHGHGVNKTGHLYLFPLRSITDLELQTFLWRIILRCTPVADTSE